MKKIIFLLLLTSCANGAFGSKPENTFEKESSNVTINCEAQRYMGFYRSYTSALNDCEAPQVFRLAQAHRYPRMDVLQKIYAYKTQLATMLDQRQITQDQAKKMLDAYVPQAKSR